MTENPLLLVLMTAVGVYVAWLWRADYRAAKAGKSPPGALPGTTPASRRARLVAVAGSLALLAIETVGEKALGVAGEQSRMTALFAAYSLTAAVVEEIIFRGYLVITRRGEAVKWLAIAGASVLFALIHPFLWHWDHGLTLTFTTKAVFSTAMTFLFSLWFYACRFGPWNPSASLLPCFGAHAAKNIGVIAIKAAQGFLVGAW